MGSRQLQAATRRTNAAIEAHFRAVKHRKLFKRRSVRPREFIDAQLAYLNAKINETKIPKKLTTYSNLHLADATERWCKRRRTGKYANKNIIADVHCYKKWYTRWFVKGFLSVVYI
jgi:hypothetical protein